MKREDAVTGTFAPVTLTVPDGKTFTAYTLNDDSGQAHLIYHRLTHQGQVERAHGRTASACARTGHAHRPAPPACSVPSMRCKSFHDRR